MSCVAVAELGTHWLVVERQRVWWAPWRRRCVLRCVGCALEVHEP